jgi:hypothetical protein
MRFFVLQCLQVWMIGISRPVLLDVFWVKRIHAETPAFVPGSFRDVTAFDHTIIDVCLPLGRGNKTVNELWELVNLAGEDHNFHIHQTKFRVLTTSSGNSALALVDNIPVLHGAGNCDGSVASWRSGACQVKPVIVSIPFSEVGDFVYHCPILEHEDGGMMAHIRVVPYK